MNGYTFLHANSITNAGGVGVYISNELNYDELTFNLTFYGCENIWLKITCPYSKTIYAIKII